MPSRIPTFFFPPRVSELEPNTLIVESALRTTALSWVFDVPIVINFPKAPVDDIDRANDLSADRPTSETPLALAEIALMRAGVGWVSEYVASRSPVGESFHIVKRLISLRNFVTGSATTPSGLSGGN